jgi:hypothetical protein
VLCQAGSFQQLFLLDENGEIVSRDIPQILGTIKCTPDLKGLPLPEGYNAAVMRVKRLFAEEVKHRKSEREHTVSLSHGQRYVIRELRAIFSETGDEDIKGQINILERAFRGSVSGAVKKELNLLRRNKIIGDDLLNHLVRIYRQHNMKDWPDRRVFQEEDRIPRVICSEGLV